jgi:hypothetical protein
MPDGTFALAGLRIIGKAGGKAPSPVEKYKYCTTGK